jgi:predicted HicB family RNase H-like nuclease
MNKMTYHGYAARVEFDARNNIFVGHLAGIEDIVGFHAADVVALRAAFVEAVDDYVETCTKLGKPAQRVASGKLMLRIPPEAHAAALRAAELAGKSLNQWAGEVLRRAADR